MQDTILDGVEKSVQDVLAKLNFIASMESGTKVDLRSLSLQNANSWSTSFYRTLINRGESRETALEFIRSVVSESFKIASSFKQSSDPLKKNVADLFIHGLEGSIQGITNMINTYQSDTMFVAKLRTLIQLIQVKLKRIAS